MTDLYISKGLIIKELKHATMMMTPTTTSKNNWFYEKKQLYASITLFSTFLWQFHWMTLRWNPQMWLVFWRTWTHNDEFSFLFLNLDKVLKNSIPGQVTCIRHIEEVQIDTIKIVPSSMITCHFSCGDPENECPALLCFSLICLQQGESWYLYLHFLELCCKEKKGEFFMCRKVGIYKWRMQWNLKIHASPLTYI